MSRRTISIEKEIYDVISKSCKSNTLVMGAWAQKTLLDKIQNIEFIKNSETPNSTSVEILNQIKKINESIK